MRYPVGSGSLMILSGAMTTGISQSGSYVGWITFGWGCLSVLAHMWLKPHGAAVNVCLTGN